MKEKKHIEMERVYRIGTRGSKLAIIQAKMVAHAIQSIRPDFLYELIIIKTTGDKFFGNLSKVGGKGAFVKEIEDAMIKHEVDLAMHSMKDVPSELPEGLILPCILKREDIRDVACCKENIPFNTLPQGALVGTSALRRTTQIQRMFPHLKIAPLRGNVLTRLQKLKNREFDAIILAKAGLDRLEMSHEITTIFDIDQMLPAAGQGAIGVECRENDRDARKLLDKISHPQTSLCVSAEREMIRLLGGTCHTPIAGYCEHTNHELRLTGLVCSVDGTRQIKFCQKGPHNAPHTLGQHVADNLLKNGAKKLIEQ